MKRLAVHSGAVEMWWPLAAVFCHRKLCSIYSGHALDSKIATRHERLYYILYTVYCILQYIHIYILYYTILYIFDYATYLCVVGRKTTDQPIPANSNSLMPNCALQAAAVQTTIPPIFLPELMQQLEVSYFHM